MAKEATPAAAEGAEAPKSKKKLFMVLGIVLVLILSIGGGGAYFLLSGDPEDEEEDVAVEPVKAEKKKAAKEMPPVYVPLDPFTVNLVPETGDQFLQLILSIEVDSPLAGDRVKMYTPKIRNDITLLLSSKKASDLITTEGKQALSSDIRKLINEVLSPETKGKDGPVKDVLFTSFIIQ